MKIDLFFLYVSKLHKKMSMTWIIAAGIYIKYVQKVAVATVCTRVYLSGNINGYEDHLKQTKKPIMRNLANMAGGVGIGLMEAVAFPVYIPALSLWGIYMFLTKK